MSLKLLKQSIQISLARMQANKIKQSINYRMDE